MKRSKLFLLVLLFGCSTFVFATSNQDAPDPSILVAALAPVVVWLATFVVTKVWSKIPAFVVMLVVALLSWGYTQLTGIFEAGTADYWLQILAGIGATFVNEILKATGFKSSKSKEKIESLESEVSRLRSL